MSNNSAMISIEDVRRFEIYVTRSESRREGSRRHHERYQLPAYPTVSDSKFVLPKKHCVYQTRSPAAKRAGCRVTLHVQPTPMVNAPNEKVRKLYAPFGAYKSASQPFSARAMLKYALRLFRAGLNSMALI